MSTYGREGVGCLQAVRALCANEQADQGVQHACEPQRVACTDDGDHDEDTTAAGDFRSRPRRRKRDPRPFGLDGMYEGMYFDEQQSHVEGGVGHGGKGCKARFACARLFTTVLMLECYIHTQTLRSELANKLGRRAGGGVDM
nr:hypothetical protein CFP56_30915 [Quercus suber]